jgi:glycyl-tRNA synthetase beta subunit
VEHKQCGFLSPYPLADGVDWLAGDPFEYAGLVSGITRGLRFHDPEEIRVRSVDDYNTLLATQGILLEPGVRQRIICEQVGALADQVGGTVVSDPALLAE